MIKGFIAGLIVANGFEWVAHKYILHGVHRTGQPRYSPVPRSMASHWAHHREVKTQNFHDDCYVEGLASWRTRNELLSLGVVAATSMAIFAPLSKGMAIAAAYSAINYFYVHRKAHLQPDWAKHRIPWHVDHHMNANQDANWCVTKPWFDYLLGTRVVSSPDLKEANPLGIWLPRAVSQRFTHVVERLRPVKWTPTALTATDCTHQQNRPRKVA
ncbi:hypothetical protein [uncultured Acinetobacter sp.]|uniref:hypothetical protein n=1 Tax=uncultured Acinetobacter sp. TaxID=165433 RepID=UPI003749180C